MNDASCKVLIVEDDPGISKFLRTTLNTNHYEVLWTDTGVKALEMISSHCPDCILLDLGLPDLDGTEVIRRVRSWTKTPIIVISARSMEEDKAYALDLGADDYLQKPFGTIELLARIRTALRHTRHGAGRRFHCPERFLSGRRPSDRLPEAPGLSGGKRRGPDAQRIPHRGASGASMPGR